MRILRIQNGELWLNPSLEFRALLRFGIATRVDRRGTGAGARRQLHLAVAQHQLVRVHSMAQKGRRHVREMDGEGQDHGRARVA
jgi:hypothetical protein